MSDDTDPDVIPFVQMTLNELNSPTTGTLKSVRKLDACRHFNMTVDWHTCIVECDDCKLTLTHWQAFSTIAHWIEVTQYKAQAIHEYEVKERAREKAKEERRQARRKGVQSLFTAAAPRRPCD